MSNDAKRLARLAIDIGGTFTDIVVEVDGQYVTTKVLTTSEAPERGVLEGIDQVLLRSGLAPPDVRLVIHGTTLATNALIERKGAQTALIVTEGHRDAVEMAYENRFEQYDIAVDRPMPLVPRYLRLPVRERVDVRGKVLIPLDEASVECLIPVLREHLVTSLAIGLVHGYANPDHERRIARLLRQQLPDLAITLASEVCPEVREYERLSTACANAYVQPLMAGYLLTLQEELVARGLGCPFLLMTSGGGLTSLDNAIAYPIRLIESGPAGGAILAGRIAAECGLDQAVSVDMGGTTAKLCLIDDCQPLTSRDFEVARSYRFMRGSGLPVRVPVIEMVEIGAGGGSIASVDPLGHVQVGPESAGSNPGPAAYGRGGDRPTVTDADIALGRIDPDRFAGGAIDLDPARSNATINEQVGKTLQMEESMAAFAVAEVVDENMANAARTHAIEWGKDITSRVMIAFGGSAPLHAARLAEKLRLDRVIVPTAAGVGSAVGFLLAPIAYEVVRSRYMRLSAFDSTLVTEVIDEMRSEALKVVQLGAPDALPEELVEMRHAYMRYVGQGHEVAVDLSPAGLNGNGANAFHRAFEAAYTELYGRTIPDLDIEVLSWTLVIATAPQLQSPALTEAHPLAVVDVTTEHMRGPACDSSPTRRSFDGETGLWFDATVYERRALTPGIAVPGPALIVEEQTTTVVPASFSARVDHHGYIELTRRAERKNARRAAAEVHRERKQEESIALDRLRGQILWDRLLSVVEEQAKTLVRTAFSTPVREAGDLSAGAFDLDGRMLTQAITGTPGHVNAMAAAVGHFLQRFPIKTLENGDALITNDPWKGTGHLNDFTVVTPAFLKGRPVALFAATSHIADVGGRGFGPDANQVFEEGIRIPITYLFRRGEVNTALMEVVRANVRDPDVAEGDLYSLVACNRTGCERLIEMMHEFGLENINELSSLIVDGSHTAMLAAIRQLPAGRYENSMTIDGYNRALDLVCALEISENGILVDFEGTSPISHRGINVPLTYTKAYASFGIRCVVGPTIPNNAGSLSTVRVIAPEGCILNAPPPCAVSARHAVGQMLPDVVLGCLEQALDGGVPAEGASCLWNPVLMGGRGLTGEFEYGDAEPFVVNPFHTGGTGARPGKDGLSATAFPSGVRSTPVEITETVAPLVFWRKEYMPDSGGAGEYRGGLGQVMEISHADSAPMAVSKMFDRIRHPARGRQGGKSGRAGRVTLDDGTELRGMGREVIPPGRHLVLETAGGGGLGDSRDRGPERIEADVRDGYVSGEAAARDYGRGRQDD